MANDNLETILGVKLILPSQEPQDTSTPSDTQTDREPDQEYDVLNVREIEHYTVKLGRQGENDTQNVRIDCSDWLTELPNCQLMIAALRPGEREIYVPEVTVSGGVVTWPIMAQDTALAGVGRAEVRALLNEKVKKSVLFKTRIEPALDGNVGGVPTTPPNWARAIMDSVETSQAAAEAAREAAERAEEKAKKGLSDEAKEALLNLLQHVAYVDDQGQSYYDALEMALYGGEVTSLSAIYTPGSFKVYDGDSLDVLRPYLTVTAHYYSGEAETVQDYTLSGTLVEGTQTITAKYMGQTATFTVSVESGSAVLYNLESPITMDGVDKTLIVNTGVNIAQEDVDFTIMVEFTSDNTPAWRMLLYDMGSASPYPGYSFTIADDASNRQFRFMDKTAEYWFAGVNSSSDIVRFVYSHQANGTVYARLSVNGTERQLANWIERSASGTVEKPLIIGGDINASLTKLGSPWKGTIRKATLLNRASSQSEITDYLTAGILG